MYKITIIIPTKNKSICKELSCEVKNKKIAYSKLSQKIKELKANNLLGAKYSITDTVTGIIEDINVSTILDLDSKGRLEIQEVSIGQTG